VKSAVKPSDYRDCILDLRRRIAELEAQLAEAQRRIAELEAGAQERFRAQWKARVGNPFFKAARAAADERMVALKHEARAYLTRAETAERQLAEANEIIGRGRRGKQVSGEETE
jgi:chaperonin cofactor prefoldin